MNFYTIIPLHLVKLPLQRIAKGSCDQKKQQHHHHPTYAELANTSGYKSSAV